MYSPVTARKQFSEALCRWLTDRPDVVFSVFFARGFLERGDANSDVADFLPRRHPGRVVLGLACISLNIRLGECDRGSA